MTLTPKAIHALETLVILTAEQGSGLVQRLAAEIQIEFGLTDEERQTILYLWAVGYRLPNLPVWDRISSGLEHYQAVDE